MSKKVLFSAAIAGLLVSPLSKSASTAHARDFSLSAGAVGIVSPRYEGSKSYKVIGFPLLYPRFTGGGASTFTKRVSFKGADDLRYKLFDTGNFEAGPIVGYRSGRDADDGVLLGGLGDIDASAVLGGYASYSLDYITFDASIGTGVFGDANGFQARFAAETDYELTPELKLTARFGTTVSSDEYMDTFFGVTPAQAAASTAGLPVYDPDTGFKDVFVQIGTEYRFNENWRFGLGVKYSRLVGDAEDSPVIETKNQFSGSLRLVYDF